MFFDNCVIQSFYQVVYQIITIEFVNLYVRLILTRYTDPCEKYYSSSILIIEVFIHGGEVFSSIESEVDLFGDSSIIKNLQSDICCWNDLIHTDQKKTNNFKVVHLINFYRTAKSSFIRRGLHKARKSS